jgi:hypothetical protein
MKIHSIHFYLSFILAAALPVPSYAQVQLPNWLNPFWIQAKLMDFHITNTERVEQVQAQAQAKKNAGASSSTNANGNGNGNGNVNGNGIATTVANADQIQRKTGLAPVETAQPKMNEKYLSKEELAELRKQLRQKP